MLDKKLVADFTEIAATYKSDVPPDSGSIASYEDYVDSLVTGAASSPYSLSEKLGIKEGFL